jgi:hypothetical protein
VTTLLSRYQAKLLISPSTGLRTPHSERRRNVAIVGFGEMVPAHSQLAPYNDPTWEVWALNHANRCGFMKDDDGYLRADRWFELHQLLAQSDEDMKWIRECQVPLYMTEPFPENPSALLYPLAQVLNRFSSTDSIYFASSFAYMVALALMEGFETIGLYGCDLAVGREQVVENGNLAYWVGLARGMGRTVCIPGRSSLCRHPALYGFQYHAEGQAVEHLCARLIHDLLRHKGIRAKHADILGHHLLGGLNDPR